MKNLLAIALAIFMYGQPNAGQCKPFATYQGRVLDEKTTSFGQPDFEETLENSVYLVLGYEVAVDEAAVEAELNKEAEELRKSVSQEEVLKWRKTFEQIRVGADYYRSHRRQGTKEDAAALSQAWDRATSAGVAEGLSEGMFKDQVVSLSASDAKYESFVKMKPQDVEDVIAKSKSGWRKGARRRVAETKLADDIKLTTGDLEVLSSAGYQADKMFRHIQTTESLLALKKGFVLKIRTAEKLIKHGEFASPELRDEFTKWWAEQKEIYRRWFPAWTELN